MIHSCIVCDFSDARGLTRFALPSGEACQLCGTHALMAQRSGVAYISSQALIEALRERRSADRRTGSQDELAHRLACAFITEKRERCDRRAAHSSATA
jgi:hypothetical protein